jgi:GNAT superfamily N-acetyltransferase
MYTFHEELPTTEKYNELREAVGWGALDAETVGKSLPRSVYVVTAKMNGETVGFARMVGDGGLCFYIQEIIVHPQHQKRGIAKTFMKYIFAFLNANAGKRSYIGVFVGRGLEAFYRKYGFWERPTNAMGPGMMQFWNDKEYNDRFNGGK